MANLWIKDKVIGTSAYQGMSKIRQNIIKGNTNLQKIKHGVELVKNIGIEQVESKHNFSFSNLEIIKELVSNE